MTLHSFLYVTSPGKMQLALYTALLSIAFQNWDDILYPSSTLFHVATIGMVVGLILYYVPRCQSGAVTIFVAGFLATFLSNWSTEANHTWLAAWTIAPVVLISRWWISDHYINYLRYTFGLVMIVAGFQKIIAGTYLDGSYIAWLSFNGSPTEQIFSFLCNDVALINGCVSYQVIGAGIILWQIAVGIFLLLGLRSLWVLVLEVGFLISAGLYADEMNFQILNIALLTIIFKTGMSWVLFIICLLFLVIDVIGVDIVYSTLVTFL